MKAVACYIRVSEFGPNQAGQRREINRWLKSNRIAPKSVRWYVDKPAGDNLDRPDFQKLQTDIVNGEVGTVVIWRLGRLSLTARDGLNVLCDWCAKSLRIVSVSQQIDCSGTLGKKMAPVLFAVAEMARETRRERTKAGLEAAKARGVHPGRKPGITKAKPARAKKMAAKGMTLSQIAAALGVSRSTAGRYVQL